MTEQLEGAGLTPQAELPELEPMPLPDPLLVPPLPDPLLALDDPMPSLPDAGPPLERPTPLDPPLPPLEAPLTLDPPFDPLTRLEPFAAPESKTMEAGAGVPQASEAVVIQTQSQATPSKCSRVEGRALR